LLAERPAAVRIASYDTITEGRAMSLKEGSMVYSARVAPPRRFRKLATLAVAVAALGAVAVPLGAANAQIYLGWDFGNGFGVGIGTPPSAYTPCPNYGFGPTCYYPR
jgi:hypothetical protein